MLKNVLTIVLTILSFAVFSADFKAELKVENPSDEIDDGQAYVIVSGGTSPFTYKWSSQDTPLNSSDCEGLTEGSEFSVIVTDADGNSQTLAGVVKTESPEEKINAVFVPIVSGMSSFLFWDPFSALKIYDPVVYADLKNVKAAGWSNDDILKIVLKEWVIAEGELVKKGDFIAVVTQDNDRDVKMYANATGKLRHNVAEGKVIYDANNIQDVIEVGAENLASIIYDSPQPVLHPNGDKQEKGIPFIVVWLVVGAIFFTLRMKFVNIRGFKHAIQLVAGKFSDPDSKDDGEVSHFQALTTALSATVGLGNIAGVAVAITLGGPGATFWMIIAGLIGMSSKFVECTLGVKYRRVADNGEISGGPMYYLSEGLKKKKLGGLGKVLAVVFAILCIGGSFGGGNMFQANQAFAQLSSTFPSLQDSGLYFGIILAILVGVVIIGGIKSIAKVTDKIVPFMAVLYVTF